MPLSLRIMQPKVKRSVIRIIGKACEAATDICGVRHRIRVLLFPVAYLIANNREVHGFFSFDVATAEIHIAAANPERDVLQTLSHELVHYEQWRDGDMPTDQDCEREALDREGEIYKRISQAIRRRRR